MTALETAPFTRAGEVTSAPPRREVKFALDNVDEGKFRSILDVNCRRVQYVGATSRIVSIYFDDAVLSACRANLDGTPRRTKTRIRWYDTPFPEKRFFFEVKRREDEAIVKERVPIDASAPLDTTPFHEIVSSLGRALPDRQREVFMARPEAKLMIEYERAYYEALDAPVRITLDRDLVFWSQIGKSSPDRRFGTRAVGLTILEAKSPLGHEGRIRQLLHPLAPWVTRSSKYVLACQHLQLL